MTAAEDAIKVSVQVNIRGGGQLQILTLFFVLFLFGLTFDARSRNGPYFKPFGRYPLSAKVADTELSSFKAGDSFLDLED